MANYDLAIIGSGPGGYVTAIRAAQWGLKTVVIEKDGFLGGTCLHVGCIPTKVLLHHAEIYDTSRTPRNSASTSRNSSSNWAAALARKDKIVNRHAKGIEFLFRKNKVETCKGWGRWAGPGRVTRGKGRQDHRSRSHAHHVRDRLGGALAAGRRIDGKIILGNREILKLPTVPKTLVMWEPARWAWSSPRFSIRSARRSPCSKCCRASCRSKTKKFPPELESLYEERHPNSDRGQGRKCRKKTRRARRSLSPTRPARRRTISAERVLMAVGRAAEDRKSGPGENRKPSSSADSFTSGRTWKPTSRASTPSATSSRACRNWRTPRRMEGITCRRENHRQDRCRRSKSTRIPNAHLLRAADRLDRADRAAAREAGYDVKIGKFPFLGNSKASILGHHEGFIKVVAEEKYGEILGVHIIGPLATEIIAEAVDGAAAGSHRGRHDVHGARASHGVGSDGRRVRFGARTGDQHLTVRRSSNAVRSIASEGLTVSMQTLDRDLGRSAMPRPCGLQQRLVAARKAGAVPDVLLLCEHPHVITLGRNGKLEHLLASERLLRQMGVEFHERSRRRHHLPRPGTDRRLSDSESRRNSPRCGLVRAPARRGHDSHISGIWR